ncbi:MAG: GLPGLI family protein [Saprospiraceae bacterium]|nr:GLPGLI family protein [Saprospiraceae bacterium]
MKKTLLLLALFISLSAIAQEQPPLEGRIRYLVVHDWAKKMAAVDYLSKQRKERIAYMWGNRSEWKLYTQMFFNATETRYEDSEERAEPDDEGYSWRKDVYQIKRNFEENTQYDVMEMLGKTYIIEDSLHSPEWKIHNDLKEVAGHICMKAVWEDTVKRQKVVAWFAQDIPHSGGPERFSGLPGMILEVDVNNGAMVITADLIEQKKLDKQLNLPKKYKGKKITEAEYQDIVKKYIEEKTKAEEPYFWGMRY